ncbi:MAG: peroxidase family protein [Pirellulaceae bacterium]|nr:peroxidase family protein [Pirellulaceae bacterium]
MSRRRPGSNAFTRYRPAIERLEVRRLLTADLMSPPADLADAEGGEAVVEETAEGEALRPRREFRRPGRGPQRPRGGPPEVRAIDAAGNNVENEEWGSVEEALLRWTTPDFADGVAEPAGEDRPSARLISNEVAAQTESVLNESGLTDLAWLWGQFVDHDIDLTTAAEPIESLPIEVPTGDPIFDPEATGEEVIDFDRSVFIEGAGVDTPRLQYNEITSYLDGSVVYGSAEERAAALREFEGGRLLTSAGDLPPFNETGLDNAGGTSDTLFLAGDIRANENAALSAMHTIWVREHNRIADELAERHPDWTDEQLYQAARRIVTAEIQAITFNEFLPALLGEGAIAGYTGYDPQVNAGIANIFSTAAYRFGHSMLSSELPRINEAGEVADEGNLALRDAFFAPDELISNGVDSLLRGAASHQAQEIDSLVVDDVRNFLFGPPGSGGFDLASLNIQRGRDHGLPDYNQARVELGLDPVESFSDITSDADLAARLEELYGDVDNIDVWVGGLAEDHAPGSNLGELFTTVIARQFENLRDGDRFWYQNTLSGRQLAQIEHTTLADVISRNTGVADLQENVFFIPGEQPATVPEGEDAVARRPRGPGPLGPGPLGPRPLDSLNLETPELAATNDDAGEEELDEPAPQAEQRPGHTRRGRGRLAPPPLVQATDEFFAQFGE